MKNINIIYWSASGNTEEMANLILEGVIEEGNKGKLIDIREAKIEDVEGIDGLFIGSPSMGSEVIEEARMEPFIESIKDLVKDKRIGLFGSYDWGNGEWMENWVERMKSYGADVIGQGCIVNLYPEDEDRKKCIDYGKSI